MACCLACLRPCRTQTAVSFELFATERTGACYTCEAGMAELGCCVLRLPPRWAECGEVRRQGTSGYPLKVGQLHVRCVNG